MFKSAVDAAQGASLTFIVSTVRFLLRHLDPDLEATLERTVPPVALEAVTAFKISLAKHAKQAGRSKRWFCLAGMSRSPHVDTREPGFVWKSSAQVSDDNAKAAEVSFS